MGRRLAAVALEDYKVVLTTKRHLGLCGAETFVVGSSQLGLENLTIHRVLSSAPTARTMIAQAEAGTPAQAWVMDDGDIQALKGRATFNCERL